MAQPEPNAVATTTTNAGQTLARVAFASAVVAASVGAAFQVLGAYSLYIAHRAGWSSDQVNLALGAILLVQVAISLSALLAGAAAARRGSAPVRSGISIGVGALGVLVGVIAFAVVPLVDSLVL